MDVNDFLKSSLKGWFVFNGTFSTNRLYRAMSAQEINPVTSTEMAEPGFRIPVLLQCKQVL